MDNHLHEAFYDPYYNDNIEDTTIPDEDYIYEEVYLEDSYFPQSVGCLPIFLAAAGIALLMIFTLFRTAASVPGQTEVIANLNNPTLLEAGSISPLFTPEVQYWSERID